MTDKERALKFSKCKCNEFTYTKEISICKNCGFKRYIGNIIETSKKISKKDQ